MPFSFSVFLLFLDVCSDPQCLSADVKQRTAGMQCQLETLVYLTDTDRDLERLSLRFKSPTMAFNWSHGVPKSAL